MEEGLAAFIQPYDYSFAKLTRAIAEQSGGAHEDEAVEEGIAAMRQSHIVALIKFSDTVLAAGLPHRDRRARLGDELLGCLIKTDEWSRRIMRARMNLEHILHGRDKRRIGGGWDHPIFLQMGLDIVFFKARPTVLKCAAATISRSTTVSASRRSVQRA